MALYFAARGVGQVRSTASDIPTPYTSPARVLLNGLGSDELLGGYGRHRTAFQAGSWQAVIDEVAFPVFVCKATMGCLTMNVVTTRDRPHPNAQPWSRRPCHLLSRQRNTTPISLLERRRVSGGPASPRKNGSKTRTWSG